MARTFWLVVLLLAGPAFGDQAAQVAGETAALEAALPLLQERDFDLKGQSVDAIALSGDPRAPRLLSALLEGRLYHLKAGKRLVTAEKQGRQYAIIDALSGEALGFVKKRKLRKVAINNLLRSQIRGALATLNLSNANPEARLAALRDAYDDLQPATVDRIRRLLERETDPGVRTAMEVALALGALDFDVPAERIRAAKKLSESLEPAVRNRLTSLAQADPDETVRAAAASALKKIDERVELYRLLETLFFGLSLGSVLVLAAIGLAITFGVMGVINMAHGELIMLGAYTTYVIQQALPGYTELTLFLAVPAAFLVSGLVGVLIERGVIRFLYGRPLETLLATFGISLVLQQAVRSIFSPLNRSVETPAWMSGSLEINSILSLTLNRLYIIAFALLVFAALYLVLKRTSLGLQVRAVSQNRAMAQAMGVRSQRVDAMTFGLGSGIAGVAGVALSQLTNVGPNLGQAYIIDSFMVVVFGGVGNLWGTLVGGLGLGIANKFLEPWSGAVLAKILVLVLIILFIQKRPRGLFPQKGRAAEG